MRQKLSEGFIKEFKDKVIWCNISGNQTLSKSFFREFQDKVNWKFISDCQTLSEVFIEEFQDRVVWYEISFHQELTESFICDQARLNNSDSEYSDSHSEIFSKMNFRIFRSFFRICQFVILPRVTENH